MLQNRSHVLSSPLTLRTMLHHQGHCKDTIKRLQFIALVRSNFLTPSKSTMVKTSYSIGDESILVRLFRPVEPKRFEHRLVVEAVQIDSLSRRGKMLVLVPSRNAESVASLPSNHLPVNLRMPRSFDDVIDSRGSLAARWRRRPGTEALRRTTKDAAHWKGPLAFKPTINKECEYYLLCRPP